MSDAYDKWSDHQERRREFAARLEVFTLQHLHRVTLLDLEWIKDNCGVEFSDGMKFSYR